MHGVTKHAIVYPNHCVANVPKIGIFDATGEDVFFNIGQTRVGYV